MRQEPNTGAWMVEQKIDAWLLAWAKQESKRQFAEPPKCDVCGEALPVDQINHRCPKCGADVVPF